MKGRLVFAGLVLTMLICAGFVGGVSSTCASTKASVAPEHILSYRFDVWASRENYLGQVYDAFSVSDCVQNWEAGRPAVPVKVVNLEVPAPIEQVSVHFSNPIHYNGIRVIPNGPDYMIGLGIADTTKPLVDTRAYSRERFFPASGYELVKIGEGRGDNGQIVWAYNILIYPFQYSPRSNSAVFYQDAELGVCYSDAPSYFPPSRGVAEKYIVITSTAVNNSVALKPLLDWKTKKGLPAKSYDMAWITTHYTGYDDAEKMRNFLKDKYYNNSLEWVQLVGDSDLVPTRECVNPWPSVPYDDNWMPADTYFACLDQCSTWDSYDSDHLYGELFDIDNDQQWDHYDIDDAYPDVWVARFASNDISRITNWANNAVNYEKNPPAGTWADSATVLAPDAGSAGSADYVKNKIEEFIVKNNASQYGYLSAIYANGGGTINRLYEANGTLSRNAFINSINSGFAFGTWIAHGDVTYFTSSGTVGTMFSSTDVGSLTNGAKKPMLFGMSCLTGWFDGKECVGEAFTENNLANGAIGYVGSARITLANVNFGYQPTGVGIQMDFMYQMELGKSVDPSKLYMGKALQMGKYGFAQQWFPFWEVATKAFFEYNLFGETNCPIWTDAPLLFNPQTVVSEDASGKTVTVTVRNANNNKLLNHTLVCLENNLYGVYQYCETGENGLATFRIPSAMPDGNLTITRADFKPTEMTPALVDSFAPYTNITVTPAIANGENGWYRTSPKVKLSCDELNTKTYVKWDAAVFGEYAGELTAPEGTHTLQFYSRDWKGNSEGTRDAIFRVDSIMPVSAYSVEPGTPDGNDGWYRVQPAVTITCDDTGEPAVKYRWESDGNYSTYSGPIVVPEGKNTLFYLAQDGAGNRETARSVSFKVDSQDPNSSAVINPVVPDGQNGWYKNAPTISLFSENTDDWVVYNWDQSGETNYTGIPIKAMDGVHQLGYRGYDDAGNREDWKTVTLMVDTRTPFTNHTTEPAEPDGQQGWFRTTPTLSFAPELNCTVFYRFDAESFACATVPVQVPEGVHALSYYSVDQAGNREITRVTSFKVDTIVPSSSINITPADKGDNWYIKKPRFTLETQNATCWYYWDNLVDQSQKYSKETDIPDGEHALHYWAIDEAGNRETEKTRNFKVDSVLPSVGVSASVTVLTIGDTVSFNLTGHDQNGIDVYFLDFGDNATTGWTTDTSFTRKYAAAGFYTVVPKIRDRAGNENTGSAVRIEVKAREVPPPPPKPPIGGGGTATGWLFPAAGVMAAVAGVGAAGLLLSRRKKGRSENDDAARRAEEDKKNALMPAYNFSKPQEEGSGFRASITEQAAPGDAYAPAAAPAMLSAAPEATAKISSCPKCGNEVEADADYCYTCGERWGSNAAPKAEEKMMFSPAAAPAENLAANRPVYKEAPAEEYIPAPKAQAMDWYGEATEQKPRKSDVYGTETDNMPVAAATAIPTAPVVAAVPATPAAPAPAPRPSVSSMATASAAAGSGKMCPKCGTEMVRLVELPGAQNEQLKKLQAKGQYAFQCAQCGHFEISKWSPPR